MLLGLAGRWSRKVAGPMDIIDIHWQYVCSETNRSFMPKSRFMRHGIKMERVPVDALTHVEGQRQGRVAWLKSSVTMDVARASTYERSPSDVAEQMKRPTV